MSKLKVDLQYLGIPEEEIKKYSKQVVKIHEELVEKSKDENEFVRMVKLAY